MSPTLPSGALPKAREVETDGAGMGERFGTVILSMVRRGHTITSESSIVRARLRFVRWRQLLGGGEMVRKETESMAMASRHPEIVDSDCLHSRYYQEDRHQAPAEPVRVQIAEITVCARSRKLGRRKMQPSQHM
jgi:hypothetical protein